MVSVRFCCFFSFPFLNNMGPVLHIKKPTAQNCVLCCKLLKLFHAGSLYFYSIEVPSRIDLKSLLLS